MTNRVRIFSYLPNPRVWKSTIAGRLCGVEVEVRGDRSDKIREWLWDVDARPLSDVDPVEIEGMASVGRRGFTNTVLYKTDRFLDANPYGTVPAGFSDDGRFGVFESNSIMRLVARLGQDRFPLYGSGPYEASRVDSFLDASVGFGHDAQRYLLSMYARRLDAPIRDAAENGAVTYLNGIERALSRGARFLVGDSITLADICFTCELALLATEQRSADVLSSAALSPVLTGEFWDAYPRSLEHFDRLVSHPEFLPDTSVYDHQYKAMRLRASGASISP